MSFFRKLFGGAPKPETTDEIVMSRGPRAVHAEPGRERETFTREVASILGCEPDAVDFSKNVWDGYDLDEIDVLEFIQIAEDVWQTTIIPSPYSADISDRVRSFSTLAAIVAAATRKTT